MGLSCAVSQIYRDIGQRLQTLLKTHLFDAPADGYLFGIVQRGLG